METRVVCQNTNEKSINEYKKDCGAECTNEDDLVVRRYQIGSLFEPVRKKRIGCSSELQHGEFSNNPLTYFRKEMPSQKLITIARILL